MCGPKGQDFINETTANYHTAHEAGTISKSLFTSFVHQTEPS